MHNLYSCVSPFKQSLSWASPKPPPCLKSFPSTPVAVIYIYPAHDHQQEPTSKLHFPNLRTTIIKYPSSRPVLSDLVPMVLGCNRITSVNHDHQPAPLGVSGGTTHASLFQSSPPGISRPRPSHLSKPSRPVQYPVVSNPPNNHHQTLPDIDKAKRHNP